MKDNTVKLIQEILVYLGYVVPPDGQFEEETFNAVKHFQAKYGLPVLGEVDQKTWAKMLVISSGQR